MTIANDELDASGLEPEDLEAFETLQRTNEWLRAALCTLARRGLAFRQAQPVRAKSILDTLAPLPYYKGGQFLFDLMEWEDFMLDGPPPPILPTIFDAQTSGQVASFLNHLKELIDGSLGEQTNIYWVPALDKFAISGDDLPPLTSSLFMYQDVVLGIYASGVAVGLSRPPVITRPEAREISLELDPVAATVMPGEQVAIQIEFLSQTERPLSFSLELERLPDEWASFTPQNVTVPPGGRSISILVIQPPMVKETEARTYPYQVVATSNDGAGLRFFVDGTLLVQPYVSLHFEMTPEE